MNQPINSNSNARGDNSQLIQRLVDGELEHSARSKWLSELHEESASWRALALAFIEKQITDEALRDFQIADAPKDNNHDHASRFAEATSAKPSNTSLANLRHNAMWILGLATCLLVGVFIGSEMTTAPTDPVAVQTTDAPKQSEQPNKDRNDPTGTTELADALSRSGAPVPDDFRRALLRAGYSLRDKRTITNVSLPSGGQIELPVRDVDVTYVGLNSFQ